MIEIKNIQIAPTNFMLDVYLGEDVEDIAVKLDEIYDWRFDNGDYSHIIEEMRARRGFTDEVYDGEGIRRLVVWVKDKDDLITIGHEVLHVTWYVQRFTGFNFSYESQEIQAYLFEYIMALILKKLSDGI
jgi:hypothetical protein